MKDWALQEAEDARRPPYWSWWRPVLALAFGLLSWALECVPGMEGLGLGFGALLAVVCFLPAAVLEAIGAVLVLLNLFG